jgi:hypothetical protein
MPNWLPNRDEKWDYKLLQPSIGAPWMFQIHPTLNNWEQICCKETTILPIQHEQVIAATWNFDQKRSFEKKPSAILNFEQNTAHVQQNPT